MTEKTAARPGSLCVWKTISARHLLRMPRRLQRWIRLRSSLTSALEQRAGTRLRVDVLSDAEGRMFPDEACLLRATRRQGHVREVILRANQRPLVVARTVFSRRRVQTDDALCNLGARPLGQLLFAGGKARWLERQSAFLRPGTLLFRLIRHAIAHSNRPCWARRTMYLYQQRRLLVTEIFLPEAIRTRSVHTANYWPRYAE